MVPPAPTSALKKGLRSWGLLLLTGALAFSQEPAWVHRTLGELSVSEKVGQLLFPAVRPSQLMRRNAAWREFEEHLRERHLGGVHLFRGQAQEAAELVNRIQRTARIPLLITADMEGGAGLIFEGATRFPRALGLAATGSAELVTQVARVVAQEGRAIGVHVNFYPVMDVNVNPANPIINIRSFGDDPSTVARLGVAYLKGLQQEGMMATAKHFPGHGDTTVDSHLDLPVVDVDRARLDAVELPPFRAAVEAGVMGVMTAHIAWPRVTGDEGLPATLAPSVLTGILRQEMGFQGVVFTDALNMRGITRKFTPEEAAVRAIQAGADVLLFPEDVTRVHAAVAAAVREGRISRDRLDASVTRILEAKHRLGLARGASVDVRRLATRLRTAEARKLADDVGQRSIILVRDRARRLPLKFQRKQRVLHVSLLDAGQRWGGRGPVDPFLQTLRERGLDLEEALAEGSERHVEELLAKAKRVEVVLVTACAGLAAYRGESGLSEAQAAVLERLAATGAILVGLGNPYGLRGAASFGTVLLACDFDEESSRLAARALLGEFPLRGRLPATVPGLGVRGAGEDRP